MIGRGQNYPLSFHFLWRMHMAEAFSLDDEDDDAPRRPVRRKPRNDGFLDFITFRAMVTPLLIQVLFWLGTITCVLAGISTILLSGKRDISVVFSGLVLMVFGPLGVRIYCELIILLFKIYDELKELNKRSG
jgi:hypothetical protein